MNRVRQALNEACDYAGIFKLVWKIFVVANKRVNWRRRKQLVKKDEATFGAAECRYPVVQNRYSWWSHISIIAVVLRNLGFQFDLGFFDSGNPVSISPIYFGGNEIGDTFAKKCHFVNVSKRFVEVAAVNERP